MACSAAACYAVLEALLLVAALSVDAFTASFAYGTDKIRIPAASVVVISGICSGILAVSLFVGKGVAAWVPGWVTGYICFGILLALGLIKLFDSSIKSIIRKRDHFSKEIRFSMFSLNLILHIYADPQDADLDSSRRLSPKEAATLALALSLDGLAAGFGAGLASVNPFLAVAFSLIVGALAIVLGSFLGNRLAEHISVDLSWVSGAMLIVLAFLKL